MTITTRRLGEDVWEATRNGSAPPVTLRTLRRPDGRTQLFVDSGRDRDAVAALLSLVRAAVPGELVQQVDDDDEAAIAASRSAGFHPGRTELTVEVVLDDDRLRRLARTVAQAGVDLIGAADADLPRLRALDETIRADVPGSDGWTWTPEGFVRETFGDDFDPETYRVAVDPASGEYLGLLRVWMKPDGPKVGCLGVRRDRRGTRVAAVLAADVFATVLARGESTVTADVDDTNRSVLGVIGRCEYRVLSRAAELVHPG